MKNQRTSVWSFDSGSVKQIKKQQKKKGQKCLSWCYWCEKNVLAMNCCCCWIVLCASVSILSNVYERFMFDSHRMLIIPLKFNAYYRWIVRIFRFFFFLNEAIRQTNIQHFSCIDWVISGKYVNEIKWNAKTVQ